ncbi:MAG: flippase-like domain-containing protein [Candidatus Cloacimonetes bacterium]|nr:flippase-like domain-containing protein [Candidatus Cloacimonadota bacterium]
MNNQPNTQPAKKKSLYTIFFDALIYLSLVILVINLLKGDYLQFPQSIHYGFFIASLLFMLSGFVMQGLTYGFVLQRFGFRVSKLDAFVAFGKNVLTKYIPGKIWIMLGPASHINKLYGYAMDQLVFASFTSEFISIWVALLMSVSLLIFSPISLIVKLVSFLLWLGLTLVLFTRVFHALFERIIKVVIKREFLIPSISFKDTFALFPFHFFYWLLYGVGFLFLCKSLGSPGYYTQIIIFPFATVLGMVAIFIPGGIGVREGLLVLLLVYSGLSLEASTTVSVSSRIWFLIGEVLTFIVGFSLSLKKPDQKDTTPKKIKNSL